MGQIIFKYIYVLLLNSIFYQNTTLWFKFQSVSGGCLKHCRHGVKNTIQSINHEILLDLDRGKAVRCISCNISIAFDKVWHKGDLFKLKPWGIDGIILK